MVRLVRTDEMHPTNPAEHAQHDLELIAGHAAGDLTDTQRIAADELLQSCTSCAELRRDLIAIAAAARSLPASAVPRDYRLTAQQAARLRRGGWLRSLLRPFAAPRSTVRPMAMAFTSLGLAGLLVTTVLPSILLFGSAGSAARLAAQPTAASAPAAEVPGPRPGGGVPGATDTAAQFGPESRPTTPPAQTGGGTGKSNDAASTPPEVAGGPYAQQGSGGPAGLDQLTSGRDQQVEASVPEPSPIVIGSVLLLAIGLGLIGLRFVARRAL